MEGMTGEKPEPQGDATVGRLGWRQKRGGDDGRDARTGRQMTGGMPEQGRDDGEG